MTVWKFKLAGVLLLGVLVSVGLARSAGQWTLATDVQKYYSCLPFDWYLVMPAVNGRHPKKDELVQFTPPAYAEKFTESFEVIKIVVATAGDRWRVVNDQLFVNDEHWGDLHLVSSLGRGPGEFDGAGIVPSGYVFVLGTNPSSYDSRYWGPLPEDHITGYAHVLL